ncbi:MAG: transcription-repair coupling factor [Acidobacteria bacterium]|nr:transcription-repair coupling factor [Acidobacteriota bacterium]
MGSRAALKNFISEVTGRLNGGSRVIQLGGLTSVSAKSFVLSHLSVVTGRRFAVITGNNASLGEWVSDLRSWNEINEHGRRVVGLPSFETEIYSSMSPHAETQEQRALALWDLAADKYDVAVLSSKSLAFRTIEPGQIESLGVKLKVDADISPDLVIARLRASGFVREDPIFNVGQFSSRGGIVDVWPANSEMPLRIEFFGDTVDSIRQFDPETQLSTGHVKEVSIAPMREFAVSEQELGDWAAAAEGRFSDGQFARSLKDRTDFAAQGETFSGWEFLLPLSKPRTGSAFDYLKDAILVIDEPLEAEAAITDLLDGLERRHAALSENGEIGLKPEELFLSPEELRERLSPHRLVELRALGRQAAVTDDDLSVTETSATGQLFLFPVSASTQKEIELTSRPTQKFRGDIKSFVTEIAKHEKDETRIVMQTQGLAERFEDLSREMNASLPADAVIVGSLSSGFEMPSLALRFFTETDVFGPNVTEDVRESGSVPRRKRSKLGAFVSDFRDLKPGDYVVHVDHGVGRFDGLQTISTQGTEREFMLLVYADNAKLFVPVERMDLVSRYSSGEATSPSLDRLGGIGWQKTKARAKRAMRDMADELLKLYAERKLVKGYAFSPDAPWQHEFEDAFPFELTTDQGKAIEDVKADMETAEPMDRLIVGDVGYGKTEVAMRAAFKAIMDGKQVAVLAPTTILAYQHFESFSRRFAAFPAKIDLLSRFRSPKEQKNVVAAAEKGDVDVLIGTHRILSNDVSLPKLGLVIVDEEQRFGVAHKEKLKQLRKRVDVLTLSATPIPRTLNMSLLGMRDMSVIETPPRDRLSINTQVVQFSEGVIRSAIDLELARNGQIFFIHNRVETIEAIAALLQKIVPNARIAIGHGQMNEKEMEKVMLDFIDYKYDVLVATTIIENGIDIPRANTILINRADNYGLSQLYQLRGRVGRSNRRAYAYMLIPAELELTPIARRRLSAIREFSDLGAGFRIAALDLELRGAGNLLGGQQSGHLDALGFDLYTKMLERTIAELQGEEVADETSVSINLGIDVSIPKDYMIEASQRLRTYKRISSAGSEEELSRIHSELRDRYGSIPESVDSLFGYARVRRLADEMGVISIDRSADGVAIKLSERSRVDPEKLMTMVQENADIKFSANGILRFPLGDEDMLNSLLETMRMIRG